MVKGFWKEFLLPVIVFSSSIIGVGIFALPYVAAQSGIWLMLFYFLVLGSCVALVHIIFAKVSLQTPDYKRFPGFIEYHFGKKAGAFYVFSTVFSYYSVLLLYLIAASDFLSNIFSKGNNIVFWSFIFWAPVCLIIYFGIKAVSKAEIIVMASILVVFTAIFINGFDNLSFSVIFSNFKFQISNFFLPYGAVIFSLWGIGMIPEIEEMMGEKKQNLKKVIAVSLTWVALIYLFFIFLILGVSGAKTTEIALIGLKDFLSPAVYFLALSLGAITTFSGSIILGMTLRKVFTYDLGVKKNYAWIFVCCLPMILFLVGLRSFVPLISFIGGVLLSVDGIFVLLMYVKIGGQKAVAWPLMLIFFSGIIYQLFYFVK